MKKTIVALSLALISAIGFNSFAQAPQNKEKGEKKDKRELRDKQRPDRQRPNPFEGITLTADQQSKLEALNKECHKNDSVARSTEKQRREDMKKANREKGMEMMKARQQQKRDYLNKIKAILTPEQYVTFLENKVLNMPVVKDKMNRGDKQKKDRKDGDMRKKMENRENKGPRRDKR